MRCHICDERLEKIELDKRTGRVLECPKCIEEENKAEYERLLEELEQEDVLSRVSQSPRDTEQPVEAGLGVGVGVSDDKGGDGGTQSS